MNDVVETKEDLEKVQPTTKSGDGKIFCRRCWRVEYHFHVLREPHPTAYISLCIMTLGIVKLLGPYRCRCCGQPRLGSFDLTDAQRSRQGGPTWKARNRKPKEYEPFRTSFSISRFVRRGFRQLKRLNPLRKRGGHDR